MTTSLIGVVGGSGGNEFADYCTPENTQVTAIQICADEYINSIQLFYANGTESVALEKVGGEGGTVHLFELQDGEYITGVSGCAGDFIDHLVIHTNLRTSESFGGEGGVDTFSLFASEGQYVVGFYGSAGWFIDSIGLIGASIPVVEEVVVEEVAPVVEAVAPVVKKAKPAKKKKPLTPVKALQKVDGIGPKIAKLLVDAGVNGLADLADAPIEALQEVLVAAGSRYKMHDPTTWPIQAAYGAKEDWDGLTAYQATLKGGRVA